MFEVREGLYGAYYLDKKIRWLIMNHDFHWPNITKDCASYVNEC
jgi:hypothetical protein